MVQEKGKKKKKKMNYGPNNIFAIIYEFYNQIRVAINAIL